MCIKVSFLKLTENLLLLSKPLFLNLLFKPMQIQVGRLARYFNFYIDNPVALARINAGITQEELAKLMHVTQAYISKIENQDKITPKMLAKVKTALAK